MRYRILTPDGQVLGHRTNKKEAITLALQQAHRLRESIEVKQMNSDGEYEQVTIVLNPAKFSTLDEDDSTECGQ